MNFFDGKIDPEILRADIEKEEAKKAALQQRVKEGRKKMRPDVIEEYEEMIQKAKQEGRARDQKLFEKALETVKEQIQKDQEEK